jgi:hypothetical protein
VSARSTRRSRSTSTRARGWVIHPGTPAVYVYRSPLDVRILGADDEVTGAILPNFRCRLRRLFP